MAVKVCKRCGREFEGATNVKVCPECKKRVCPVCKREFTIESGHPNKVTCSQRCAGIYKKQNGRAREAAIKSRETVKERYGKENISQVEEIKEKKIQTCLEHFACEHAAQAKEVKEKTAKTNLEKWGYKSTAQAPSTKEKAKQTNLERWGKEWTAQNREVREKQVKTLMEKYGTDNPAKVKRFREKAEKTCEKRYGVEHAAQAKEIRKKISEARGKVYTETGIPVDSSYEKIIYDFCIRNNIEVEYQQKSIEYEYEGKRHTTIIDFCIDGILIECKGEQLLENCFKEIVVPIEKKLEVYEENDVVVVTGERCRELFTGAGLRYKGKEDNRGGVIGIDIELFTREPEFPYRSDRPKCYYDVKVNGEKSSHEAFYDERLRWEMIKNRIEYKGGYIDNRQVLTALNVTRKCKQPSWFNKNFAKRIIEKYATGEVIVDTFAGWGTRCEASKELGKEYIGCDLNKEVVEWHHENGRKEIQYGDAKEFRYDKECTVFICPPYKDKEVYFEGQDCELTQCEWLKICMENIPAAREYIMVCKVVDAGWEKYIVETKENKSHFGVNKEYVLCVKNNTEIR